MQAVAKAPSPDDARALGLTPAAVHFFKLTVAQRGAGVSGDDATEPVRALQFGPERFAQHGHSLAAAQRVAPGRGGPFFPRLDANIAVLRAAVPVLREQDAGAGSASDPAQPWLVDNAALIAKQLEQVRQDLPRSYFERLPRLADAPLAGLPRVYGVAWAWVAHSDSTLDTSLLRAFLEAYQAEEALALRELWALPATLRVVAVENLRRLAERTVWRQLARAAARLYVDHVIEQGNAVSVPEIERLTALWPLAVARRAFVAQLAQRLGAEGDLPASVGLALHDVHGWLVRHNGDATSHAAELAELSADHQSIRNAIGLLRVVGAADWRSLFSDTCPTLKVMQRSAVFRAEAETTQDRSLHALEALAADSKRSEHEVAQALLLQLERTAARHVSSPAQAAVLDEDPSAAAAPLYWLRGPGRPALHRALGLQASVAQRLADGVRRHRALLYLGSLSLALVLAMGLLLRLAFPSVVPGVPGLMVPMSMSLLAVLLALLPASEGVVAMAHRLVSESARPVPMPRLALADGVPEAERSLLVVPCMLSSVQGIDALVAQLARHHVANPEQQLQLALLSDGVDASAVELPGDAALLAHARQALQALNSEYGPAAGGQRFLLLHRRRRFSQSEGCWMGWERKRGKLEALIAWLASADTSAPPGDFIDLGELSRPAPAIQHLLTLDSDTGLPPGALRALVGVAAHPMNRPRVATDGDGPPRIAAGHAVLQPRVVTPLPQRCSVTWFHRLFGGQLGIDPYSAATSELYQDLFDEGSFTGKGLINVQAAQRVLVGRLPDAQVLSHDLLEGSLLRCAGVNDVVVLEDAPMHPDVAASRIHRWTRGDWQLLPFILHPRRWGLAPVHVWKMLDNLRRSLVAPGSALLLLASWLGFGLPPAWALAVVAAAYGVGPLLGAIAALAPGRDAISLLRFYREGGLGVLRALAGLAWHLTQLLTQSLLSLDAVLRALVRQTITRRRLLEWTTAAAAEAAARTELPALLRQHLRVPVVALLLTLGLLALQATGTAVQWLWAAPMLLLWALSPLATWWASRPLPLRPREQIDEADRRYLEGVAKDTWRYFERWVGPDDHHLPPDNVQHNPDLAVAGRTSPTNIGLYLLSVCCAHEMQFIARSEVARRLALTLDTLERLPRHRGHFYNWIDTRGLVVLQPAYVSTVDSGNLCAHLLVAAAACEGWAHEQGATCAADAVAEAAPAQDGDAGARSLGEQLHTLAQRMRTLALAHDFGFLYDRQRKLLHIGLRADTNELDANHYDLLASEARLASLVAIAKGDVPPRHWGALGRPFFSRGQRTGLKSWSGSMFEYLMPSLVLDEPLGSALQQAGIVAIEEQQRAARQQGDGTAPWGVSESAYGARDHTVAYQYGPQGTASLALRDTPATDHVIAPYASLMATLLMPAAATANLRALEALGARNDCGFIEALDYSPSRVPDGNVDGFVRVGTWMSHHQGMALVALTEVLAEGAVKRWARADTRLAACASLLHERAPHEVSPLVDPAPNYAAQRPEQERVVVSAQGHDEALPSSLWLGNGRYSVLLRSHGAGCSEWAGHGISRWRDDVLRDAHGHFFYIDQGHGWNSLTAHPRPDPQARYRSRLRPDRAEFIAQWPRLSARMRVWVAAEDDAELRQITLHNTSRQAMSLRLVSFFETTLARPKADAAHPAFSNLFIAARWRAARQALLFQRRPRGEGEKPLHAAHFLAHCEPGSGATLGTVQAAADRALWLGRWGDAAAPRGVWAVQPPGGETGNAGGGDVELPTGMDPAALMLLPLQLAAGASITLTFATAAADDEDSLAQLLDRLSRRAHTERSAAMAQTLAGIRLHEAHIDGPTWAAGLALNTLLGSLCARDGLPAEPVTADRRALWAHGISGDQPILLLRVRDESGVPLVRTLLALLADAAAAGPQIDVVVLNNELPSYLAPVEHALRALRDRHAAGPGPARCHLHVLRESELEPATRRTLFALARLQLRADGRPLLPQVQRALQAHQRGREQRVAQGGVALLPVAADAPAGRAPAPAFDFASDDGGCRFTVAADRHPRRPWVNVLANPVFGTQVSEAGAGMTWAGNSRMHQVTPWSNDALGDGAGEGVWLHDQDSGEVWALGRSLPPGGTREVRHRPGCTEMDLQLPGLRVQLCWTVDQALPVKQLQVQLQAEAGARPRRLRLVAWAMWQLGEGPADRLSVHTTIDTRSGGPVLLGTQTVTPLHAELGSPLAPTAWLALRATRAGDTAWPWLQGAGANDTPQPWSADPSWTCDRRELFDALGQPWLPLTLGARAGSGFDPAAVIATPLPLQPGQALHCTVLLGHADDAQAAAQAAAQALLVDPQQRLHEQRAQWADLGAPLQVRTPDPAFDALVNHWLPYQTLACRLWARAGFYQAGGAFGYRDQLQDAMALVAQRPALLAAQIKRHAARQFPPGDVQHWWHEPGGAGVRTHFADDRVWLAAALALYVQRTGDQSLLDEHAPFIDGQAVPEGKEDIYETPRISDETATIYEHAARAIDISLATGPHGLPLFGTGDWNDGMNRVGPEGRGESVWMAWFLCAVVADMLPLARAQGDAERVRAWTDAMRGWRSALDQHAWDGAWYLRGWFDDGTPLGSHHSRECRIDLIVQAWAVLTGAGDPSRARQALASAWQHLHEPTQRLVRLLHPPLQNQRPYAGYIQSYPPGVRENGGQYNHGAVWALMALARMGDAQATWQAFTALSPAHRSMERGLGERYEIEPFVMAGDIYTGPPYVGRGGWSWYTGSAGWLLRAALESMLGVLVERGQLTVRPCLPLHWPWAQVQLRHHGRALQLLLLREGADARAQAAAWAAAGHAAAGVGIEIEAGQRIDLDLAANGSVFVLHLPATHRHPLLASTQVPQALAGD